MSANAERLAARFEAVNDEVVRFVESLSADQWRADCAEEGRPVGVVAHHVAVAHAIIGAVVEAVAHGRPVPEELATRTAEDGARINARHAADHAEATREDVLALLRGERVRWAAMLRGLDDAQLERVGTAWGGPAKAYQFARGGLIGHAAGHLAAMRRAAEAGD